PSKIRPRPRSMAALAWCGATMPEVMEKALLAVEDLKVHYEVGGRFGMRIGSKTLRAVDGVTLDVKPGECLGLVGESGCGKSTLALAIMGLVTPTSGRINVSGQAIGKDHKPDREQMARTVQMVFQDPYASLNPRQTVHRTLAAPLRPHGIGNRTEAEP